MDCSGQYTQPFNQVKIAVKQIRNGEHIAGAQSYGIEEYRKLLSPETLKNLEAYEAKRKC